jgi:hypothetical protein
VNKLFKIELPNRKPTYIFTKDSWVGLVPFFSNENGDGMITPITYWEFIKEWVR